MPSVAVAPELIGAEIAKYLARPPMAPAGSAEGAARHHVLPLFEDFMGCWALTARGQVAYFAWDAPEKLALVSGDPVERAGTHVALAMGSLRYPALASICPERTADAVTCTSCDGSGRIPDAPEGVICACAGLGWLPPSWTGAA